MTENTKSGIVFVDFNGTLCQGRFWDSLNGDIYTKIEEFVFSDPEIVEKWMRGKYCSEEINRIVSSEMRLDFDFLWGHFVLSCKKMQMPKNITRKLLGLKNRFHLILVTDNMDSFDRFTSPVLKCGLIFDKVVNSWNTGSLKIDQHGLVFTKLADEFSTKITDCYLFDDSQAVISAFSKLGGLGVHVKSLQNTSFRINRI